MHRLSVLFVLIVGALAAQTTSGELEWQDRWDAYVQRTYSWKRIGMVAAQTAVEQTFDLDKCGRPPYCFPHQIGGALFRRTARTTIELGAGALLREDIRRRPSGLTGFHRRVLFALVHAPLARGPNGDWRPAYSRFAGTFGGVAVSSAWHGNPLTASRLFEEFGWSFGDYFQDALLTEFEPDMKHLARRFLGPGSNFAQSARGLRTRLGLSQPPFLPSGSRTPADTTVSNR